ncbi:MAG: hypothetical protein AABX54_00905 [Nanoarchaeota archaeon]
MGLQQIKEYNRIHFLNLFTKEILINVFEKERVKLRIETEKIKQKLINPSANFNFFAPQQAAQQPSPNKRKQITHWQELPENPEHLRQMIRKKFIQPRQQQTNTREMQSPQQIEIPQFQRGTGISGYRKIEVFLNDPTIQSVECPGPGKNVLVKKYNQTNVTKVTLSQQEIMDIINEFSNEARIPVVGGILKAAVRNMMISSVISEFVGSRFIITKTTPYSLIYR